MDNEFPPNSHTRKEVRATRTVEKAPEEKKEVKRVTTGRVIQRKKPLHKKFFEAFRPEDNKGFVEYVLVDIFAMGIRDAMTEAAHASIDNAFGGLGGGGGHRSSRRRNGGYTSYNRMGSARPRDRRDRDDDRDRRPRREARAPSDHREIVLETRVEAEEVIDNLFELISKYDVATMRDLLSMVGERHEFTDEDWGWTDLRGARVHRVREGYLLDLPRPEALD